MQNNIQGAEPCLDDILNQIKQGVLLGNTLNNFKKEINQILEVINRSDPKMERHTD